MAKIMEILRTDHADFERFLQGLEAQIAALARGGKADYDILRAIAEYFSGYAEEVHHPLEDAVYERMVERAPNLAAEVEGLVADHERLDGELKFFLGAVNAILNEQELPRDAVLAVMRRFVEDQRKHMRIEEDRFFAIADETLRDQDWVALERRFEQSCVDLDARGGRSYAVLRESIREWDREFRGE